MATCPQCGSNNSDTSTSCWKCYASLSGAPSGAAAPTQKTTPAPRPVVSSRGRSKSSPMPLIVIILLLAAGGAGAYYWMVIRPGNPSQIAGEFMRAQLNFDANKMKQLATSASVQTISQMESVFSALSQFKGMIKVEKVEPGAATVNGNEAQVPVSLGVSGQSSNVTIALAKENGLWKVDVAKSNQANSALGAQALQQLLRRGGSGFAMPGLPGIGR